MPSTTPVIPRTPSQMFKYFIYILITYGVLSAAFANYIQKGTYNNTSLLWIIAIGYILAGIGILILAVLSITQNMIKI